MSFNANNANPNLRSLPSPNPLFFSSLRFRELRLLRRRRPKRRRRVSFRSDLDSAGDLIRRSPEIIAPAALGLVSGLAILASRFAPLLGSTASSERRDIGEWILFATPTPFNRFVLLRCPSVWFEGGELLEGVNERLVREDKHYVRLSTGRVLAKPGFDGAVRGSERKLEYQRVCVAADDGGVVALDWPANLDIAEEHGLDTTMLIVPGSVRGSMDEDIRSFVCEALRRGCFPVVMNPRGCAGSPLTTTRLFSAADSDDICTAIQFINKARPWTTLMGVGWGYGANMLTKYLAEVGESTPLTAATCIDNPFDLEEATRSSAHKTVDQILTDGLVDILRSNKELFRGRDKGFDVDKALSAKSVRDFEKAISMVSYGFGDVEDFYLTSSTRNMIGNVKIPLLFIQNDEGSAPLFSIPRSSIAENPFTSLLLCSCSSSSGSYGSRSAKTWCQQLTLEWLTAVELGLLKGRHPLLEDVDITINPSKGLAFVEGMPPSKSNTKVTRLLNPTTPSSSGGHTADPVNDATGEINSDASLVLRSRKDLKRHDEVEDKLMQKEEKGALKKTISTDAELVEKEEDTSGETESGEVLQTTQVVMQMLDATMPGTLTEEKKKKVLTAVGRGESVMKALQDAVPEDVRGKLTAAVSGIVQSQGTRLNLKKLLHVSRAPTVTPGSKSKVEDKVVESSNTEGLSQDHHSPNQTKKGDNAVDGSTSTPPPNQTKKGGNAVDGSTSTPPSVQTPPERMEAEKIKLESSQNTANVDQSQSVSEGGDNSVSDRKETKDLENSDNNENSLKGKGTLNSENVDGESETGAKENSSDQAEKTGSDKEAKLEEHKDQADKTHSSDIKEDHNAKTDEKPMPDQSTSTPDPVNENAPSSSGTSSEVQPIEKEDTDNSKIENKTTDPILEPNSDSSPPSFNVAQAFGALTGLDDSTQVAVNSVFGVIEGMITQLEESSNNENAVRNEKNASGSSLEYNNATDERQENSEANLSDQDEQQDNSIDSSPSIHNKSGTDSQQNTPNGLIKSQSIERPLLLPKNDVKNIKKLDTDVGKEPMRITDQLAARKHLDNSSRMKKKDGVPAYDTSYTYGSENENDRAQNNLFSEIPTESLDSDATNALLLEYFPEEGQWMLLEQSGSNGTPHDDDGGEKAHLGSTAEEDGSDDVIEPLYAILDTEDYPVKDFYTREVEIDENISVELTKFVKKIVLDDLRIEVGRKLGSAKMEVIDPDLARELEQVSSAVSMSVGHDVKRDLNSNVKCQDIDEMLEKVGTLNGERIIRAISAAVQDTIYLRRILPIGVIIGSSFAALRKSFNVSTVHDEDKTVDLVEHDISKVEVVEAHQMPSQESIQKATLDDSVSKKGVNMGLSNNQNTSIMVGAVTAAIGASALIVHNQPPNGAPESSFDFSKMKSDSSNAPGKVEDAMSEKSNQNIVASLAEKAMSIASPVVPTKEGGGVDQDRLVAMLADLGQRGGILRLIGKVALLWGGIRGAMSLTDKLISFFHIAERPLIQRVLGFAGMVLVLWSPIAIPLLPMLVQSWATHSPFRMAELACIVGLYAAVTILIMQWGRRLRGYDNPAEKYGLDFISLPKIKNFFIGLIGGVVLVSSIQAVNALLGCVTFSWPFTSTPRDFMTWLKLYGQTLTVVGQGFVIATGVATVEELVFRSWLPEEISIDLGYHQGIIISGLVFSLVQRSPFAVPGLWLLSLILSGIKQKSKGSLSVVIGMRTGILASSFIASRAGFLIYKPNYPLWLTGTYPFHPISGLAGFVFCLILAVFLYPRQAMQRTNVKKEIQA